MVPMTVRVLMWYAFLRAIDEYARRVEREMSVHLLFRPCEQKFVQPCNECDISARACHECDEEFPFGHARQKACPDCDPNPLELKNVMLVDATLVTNFPAFERSLTKGRHR